MNKRVEILFPLPRAVIAALLLVFLSAQTIPGQQIWTTNEITGEVLEMKPLWEGGVFGAVGWIPHYRGSDEYELYIVPLPYVVYRGEVLKADRDGIRGIFYQSDRWQTDVSLSGNPPAGDNRAREGMPDLDPLGEGGPALKYYFYRGNPSPSLYLQAAARAVVSLGIEDFHTTYEGVRGGLSLNLSEYRFVPEGPWRFGFTVGVDFSDARYNGYFYSVSENQVRPDREAYDSGGGYAGFGLSGYTLWDISPRFSLGLYARWDNVSGAVYEDSPLVRERNNLVLGSALIWTLGQSARYVEADE